jgi:hypothetical protein
VLFFYSVEGDGKIQFCSRTLNMAFPLILRSSTNSYL